MQASMLLYVVECDKGLKISQPLYSSPCLISDAMIVKHFYLINYDNKLGTVLNENNNNSTVFVLVYKPLNCLWPVCCCCLDKKRPDVTFYRLNTFQSVTCRYLHPEFILMFAT